MISLAHMIHPVIVKPTSDLIVAQPVTFATMASAREFSRETVDVTLLAIQYHDEERVPLPGGFVRVPDLQRSVTDTNVFREKRKLALIGDLLSALYENSQAEYLIYTNVDIALQPYFYRVVADLIRQGYDAFVINRRSIPATYTRLEEIPLMWAETGKKHPGFDCFVFHRRLFPHLLTGDICIGTTKIGVTLISNLICRAGRFKLFEDLHLTFHIGEVREWEEQRFKEYVEHNEREALRILSRLKETHSQPFAESAICQKHYKMLTEKYR